jgi:hypothetical protein
MPENESGLLLIVDGVVIRQHHDETVLWRSHMPGRQSAAQAIQSLSSTPTHSLPFAANCTASEA